jgi:hypothetical protein
MTAIAGLVDDTGRVWIGGDSAGIAGFSRVVRADTKVFRRGPYVFGFAGSFRVGQLLHHVLEAPIPPERTRHLDAFMVGPFVDAVRECLKAGGTNEVHREVESVGATFLVGIRGHLYCIEGDYQVGIPRCGYEAIGCGDDLVRGSLFSTGHLAPRRRLTIALTAAATFSAGVCAPFVIRSVSP